MLPYSVRHELEGGQPHDLEWRNAPSERTARRARRHPCPRRHRGPRRRPGRLGGSSHAEIEATLGTVPTFVKLFPKAAVADAWAEARDLEFSDDTALSPKVKSLISLAVSAQIPCHYCVWSDTRATGEAGATDEEIAEAVAMAALTRHWSTFLNGMAVDFDQYKVDLGGE